MNNIFDPFCKIQPARRAIPVQQMHLAQLTLQPTLSSASASMVLPAMDMYVQVCISPQQMRCSHYFAI